MIKCIKIGEHGGEHIELFLRISANHWHRLWLGRKFLRGSWRSSRSYPYVYFDITAPFNGERRRYVVRKDILLKIWCFRRYLKKLQRPRKRLSFKIRRPATRLIAWNWGTLKPANTQQDLSLSEMYRRGMIR